MVSSGGNGGTLTIVDTNGRRIGDVHGSEAVNYTPGSASWRKYMRR